ncbi:MAG: DUF2520 domain-containing protein [Eubacterium sp.]|nr:DUF2520 domain-containing protein [Eubacterium sp.]
MEIGIVGAGRVGCSIGKYLKEHGAAVAGYYSKSRESVEFAATFTNTAAFPSLGELVEAVSMIFITTPDDEIRPVWEKIAGQPIRGKIICHFSGSLSSVVFSGREQAGASGCSVHPMYAFSSKETSWQQLNQVLFTMEGDSHALDRVGLVLAQAGIRHFVIDSAKKERYHAAASMVSNMMIGLYQMSIDMLQDCGFEEAAARLLVEPLVRNNIENLLATSPEQALTGPIERNDVETVRKHLAVLTEEEREVYTSLAQKLVETARRKNPDKEYGEILKVIEKPHGKENA